MGIQYITGIEETQPRTSFVRNGEMPLSLSSGLECKVDATLRLFPSRYVVWQTFKRHPDNTVVQWSGTAVDLKAMSFLVM